MTNVTLWMPENGKGKRMAENIFRILSESGYDINVFTFDDIISPYLIVDCNIHFAANALAMAYTMSRTSYS